MIGVHLLTIGQLVLFSFALLALLAFLTLGCRYFLRVTPPKCKRGHDAHCPACGAVLRCR